MINSLRAGNRRRARGARPVHAPRRLRARDGFTIVEIIVAIMVLAIGVLGLASTAAVVQRQMQAGERQSVAATIAQARFDQLTSLNCVSMAASAGANGTQTWRKGQITETWSVVDGNNLKQITETITITGLKDPLVYTTYIPCRN